MDTNLVLGERRHQALMPSRAPDAAPTRTIVVHDYSGHPGQVQLSRALAARGHRVVHQHCPAYVTGKGALEHQPGDPRTLAFEPCPMRGTFRRYSPVHRVTQELRYGWRAGAQVADATPSVAVISNVPLLAHRVLAWRLHRRRIPMVFWQQDIYSTAIAGAARRKVPVLGWLIGVVAEAIERSIARTSAAIIAISPTFLDKLSAWGVEDKTTVIPNWAPIEELPTRDRQNAWSERQQLASVPTVVYSGTLGLKHDPGILAAVAQRLAEADPTARLVVVSEGRGRQWLEEWKATHGADNLVLLDFQDYGELPCVLASADVLLAVLEPDASRYSVPSKVLTYLCAQRPIVAVMPPDNAVADILLSHNAGIVVDASCRDQVAQVVIDLLADAEGRAAMGKAGRQYAERTFDAGRAAERFEEIFSHRCQLVAQP
jgi:glycosyltransferase involved in cell wall biosynthesis